MRIWEQASRFRSLIRRAPPVTQVCTAAPLAAVTRRLVRHLLIVQVSDQPRRYPHSGPNTVPRERRTSKSRDCGGASVPPCFASFEPYGSKNGGTEATEMITVWPPIQF